MENAIDALKMAFAVFVFILALTVSITMFTQLNQASKVIIKASDITAYYDYEISDEKSRIVGLETIIPTLYKYYTENYTVLFLNVDGSPLKLYKSQTDRALWGNGTAKNIIGKYYSDGSDNNPVCTFDLSEEILRNEPWVGNQDEIKANIDAFINGKKVDYTIKGVKKTYDYTYIGAGGFYAQYSGRKFKEISGEYTYNLETEEEELGIVNALLKEKKKRVIIYQLQPI